MCAVVTSSTDLICRVRRQLETGHDMHSDSWSFFLLKSVFGVHPVKLRWARKLITIQKLKADKPRSFNAVKQRLSKGNSTTYGDRPRERL